MPSGRVQSPQTCLLFQSKVKRHSAVTGLIVLCWPGVFVSNMCDGSMPHNQTCVMAKSTDPVAIMAGLLV